LDRTTGIRVVRNNLHPRTNGTDSTSGNFGVFIGKKPVTVLHVSHAEADAWLARLHPV
jgi:hypothetical protein